MLAIGATPSLQAAGVAYILSVLLMVASPFLKGLGAIELSMVYVLGQYGYSPAQALAITIIYRFFEFWLPLFSGVFTFLLKGKEIILRVFPAILIFTLGIINILSVVTPPMVERLHFVRSFIPIEAIHVTNLFVLYIGLTLLVTAAFLIKGRRSAWWIALIISFLSIPGHLIKAWDYEEALLALLVFASLVFTRPQYRSKSNPAQVHTGLAVAILGFVAVLIYGFVGFYFLEKKHFGLDFSWQQSIINSVRGFFLLNPENLHPLTRFGREFLRSFHFMGLTAWLFLLFSLIRPYLHNHSKLPSAKEKAQSLLHHYGRSAVDYFKLSDDKLLFVSNEKEGFVSYRIAGNFAIVLEEPVCAEKNKVALIKDFDRFCHDKGLKAAFYRVDEESVGYFTQLKKKKLIIGQEALLDIATFDLAGRSKKALRNSLNSLQKKGFTTRLCEVPHSEDLLQQLKAVSDEWLYGYKRKELVFAQGSFDATLLQQQDVIASFDAEGKVAAFLNIIPDFAPDECTYDLIRKTLLAPGGCMDALIIELINYARQRNLRYLNLGMVPFSGITQPDNPAEQVMRFAYNKIKRFKRYQGLREFKEKYASAWLNKYLIYENDFDLLQLPQALNKVMQKEPPKRVAL
jgi:phosphatidylglycerol lysyltransferase